ncbi:MAG: DEAD/DEAH box helicase [Promethearchaeota archaeon]
MVEIRGTKPEEKNSYLEKKEVEYRHYQEIIAQKCVGKNSLVVIPTGLGKTIIGVLVAAKLLEMVPSDSKIIILAPTRPLIEQHFQSFLQKLSIPKEKFAILTGKIAPSKRTEIFETNQVLFFTPHTLRNDLVNKKYDLSHTCLVIFDEAHHASGDYPYPLIADKYKQQNSDGTILALTASPGASKKNH